MPYEFKSGEDEILLAQEKETILQQFNNEVAWRLGNTAYQKILATYPGRSAVIDITLLNGHKLFRAAIGNDTQLDNESWVQRKLNTVKTYNHSSFYIGAKLTLQNKPALPEQFALHGGSFPIRLQGSDFVIATLTISGLAQNEDHQIAYETLKVIAQEK